MDPQTSKIPETNIIVEKSGLAKASFILAILSIFLGWIPIIGGLLIILAIILGIIALVKISKTPGLGGKTFAILGIVIPVITIILYTLILSLGSIIYFGTLSPDKFIPERCTVESGSLVYCERFEAQDSTVILNLRGAVSEPITITNISLDSSDETCVDWTGSQVISLDLAKEFRLMCKTLTPGDYIDADLAISFSDSDGNHQTIKGKLSSEVK